MNYEETMQWIAESKAQREQELAEFEERAKAVYEKNEDQMIRLDLVSRKLEKFRGQLDNIAADLVEYMARTNKP